MEVCISLIGQRNSSCCPKAGNYFYKVITTAGPASISRELNSDL